MSMYKLLLLLLLLGYSSDVQWYCRTSDQRWHW